ncbi:MAG TPA: site-2 protease family protein [Thermoleophilaceae bacterium]|jgi:Zn-dependent protease|nr:site-2 protease family protein [Thermoleophilaceae bacterium]
MEQGTEQYPSLWRTPDPAPQPEPEPEYQYEPPQSPIREDRSLLKRIGGGIVALGVLLAKLGAQLKWLLVLLPKMKILTTAGTMLVSTAAYAWLFGWQFGIGFVLLILVHEMGHAIQLRREGVDAGWPVFIPFLGAYIGMKEMPKDAAAEARVGLAGPVLGSIGCLVPLALYAATGNDLFRALAYIGFFLNLFNLLPILPLDGGRAMAAVSPIFWALGMVLIVAATILFPSPIIILIVLFGGLETWRRWQARKSPESKAYHDVSRGTRLAVGVVYLGLALLLGVGIHFTHFTRTFG